MEVAVAARAVDREALRRGIPAADIVNTRAKTRVQKRKNPVDQEPVEADSEDTTAAGLTQQRKVTLYAVKQILDCKPNLEGDKMYLVWWEGLRKPTGRNKDFWEPAESFANCPEVLRAFEAKPGPLKLLQ